MRAAADQALAVFLSGLVRVLNWSLLPVNHFYGTLAGLFLCVFGKNVKRITRTNLAIAFPDLNQEERAKLARKSVLELGKTMSELGPAWCGSKRRLLNIVTEVHGEDIVQQAMQDGRGVLILGPHFGAWEIAGMYLSIQYDILGLYRRPRLAALEALTRRARGRFGATMVPADMSGVRAICKALRQKKVVGILPDQDPGDSGSVNAPFFGRPVRTMLLASRLAAKSDCLVVYCVAERLPRGAGYRIHFKQAHPDVASANDLTAATAINEGIESIIGINPAQYLWSYKRYRANAHAPVNPYKRVQPEPIEPLRKAA